MSREHEELDLEAYERERQKRRAKREAERRKKLKQMYAALAGGVTLIILVIILAGVINSGRAKKKDSPKQTAASQTTSASKNGSDQKEKGGQDDADNGIEVESETDPAAVTNVLTAAAAAQKKKVPSVANAKRMALQYDYDGAIAMLEKLRDGNVSETDADQEANGNAGNNEDNAETETAAAGENLTTDEYNELIAQIKAEKETCVAADINKVAHVFFHSLINDDRGLTVSIVGQERAWKNDAAMTTVVEFDKMMDDMYAAGYVLVSLDDMCIKTTNSDGSVSIAPNNSLMLPPGKIPFVMSQDDLSYYHSYGIGTQGYATKMIVDENGKPKCVYTDDKGETKIGDYDMVPRLDTFIENHPDFAYHDARGTVAMTGYNGVFGYRTNNYYKDVNDEHLDLDQVQWLQEHPDFDWDQDVKDATAVADAMKAEGWTFASHTYGHLNAETSDLARLQRDQERWKTVNEPVLGKTDKIIFAFGADIGHVGEYTANNAKFQYFKAEGYSIFCNVDGNIGWTEFGPDYMRTGRVALDGFTMYQAMTDGAPAHTIYANDYEKLGIHDIASFFNKNRITPINSE